MEGGFHTWKLAHFVIEEKKSPEAGSFNSFSSQVRTPTFGTSLFSPSTDLVQGAGAHTVNTDFPLRLELHKLQLKSAESCYSHSVLRLLLISSTQLGKRRKQCGRLGSQNPPVKKWTSIWRVITKLLPSHNSYSPRNPTHTNISEEWVTFVRTIYTFPQRTRPRRATSYNLCAPHPLSSSCLDQLRVLWVLLNMISLKVYH